MTAGRQLPLTVPADQLHRPAPGLLRLMVFNSQHASPSRSRRQAAWIASQAEADLVVVTEVGAGPGGHALTGALHEHGYSSVLAPQPAPDYRTVLASRGSGAHRATQRYRRVPTPRPSRSSRPRRASVGLLGLYVPSRGPQQRRNQAKRAFQDAVTKALPGFLAQFSGPVIVAGDLNVVEPGHVPHLSGLRRLGVPLLPLLPRRRDDRRLPGHPPPRSGPQLVRAQRQRVPHRPHLRHHPPHGADTRLRLPAHPAHARACPTTPP